MFLSESHFDVSGFSYNPTTGHVCKGGRRRDYNHGGKGYRKVCNNYVRVLAHRLAWRLYHGEWPTVEIDHRNGVPSDNRIQNLRLATRSQNECNTARPKTNRSGEKNVYWDTHNSSWRIGIGVNGTVLHWYASCKLSAVIAARLLRRELHAEFHRE